MSELQEGDIVDIICSISGDATGEVCVLIEYDRFDHTGLCRDIEFDNHYWYDECYMKLHYKTHIGRTTLQGYRL